MGVQRAETLRGPTASFESPSKPGLGQSLRDWERGLGLVSPASASLTTRHQLLAPSIPSPELPRLSAAGSCRVAELGRAPLNLMSRHGTAAAGHHQTDCVPGVQKDEASVRPLQEDDEKFSSFHLPGYHGWQTPPGSLRGSQDMQT